MKNPLNIFVAVLLAVAESSAYYDVENKITCEWQPMTLECNGGKVLKIMSANYGRTNDSLCGSFENTNCRASGSLSIIKNNCEGQTSCTVMATNYVFGDPCRGVVKYIEAEYQCVSAPVCTANQFRCDDGKCMSKSLLCNGYPDCSEGEDEWECNVENKITCEWQPMTLECNGGKVLKIMSANYGRTNDSLCGLFEDTNCRASRSLSIIKNKCEGQTNCTVMATNYNFGDPCHGVVKYIEAEYQCVPAPACTANQFKCDDGKCMSKLLLCNGYPDCSGGEDERGCRPVCTANQFKCDDGKCMSKSLLCNGYPDCSEGEDEQECNVENKITCEWQPMTLECNRGKVLKIMSANYGRTNASLCEPFENTNCRASGSLSIIKNKCEGQTSCTVMATNYVFGDPCHGVVKYIEAKYQCVSAPVCTANQFRCDDGKCMSKSLLCNGYPDCSEGEDEQECNVENKITCEWQPMTLVCNRGKVLKIMSANYGRTNASLCEPFENTNCRAPGSLSIIKNKCEEQTSCTVMATNYVFGDPCYGVVKYIEAEYQCVPGKIHSVIAYEGQSIDKKKSANSVYSPSFGDNLMKKGMYTLLTLLKGRN